MQCNDGVVQCKLKLNTAVTEDSKGSWYGCKEWLCLLLDKSYREVEERSGQAFRNTSFSPSVVLKKKF